MITIAFPHPPGIGGPGRFQHRFENQLKSLGFKVIYAGADGKPDIIFVVGGTRKLWWLITWKAKGVPILFRLDGINWLHRQRKAHRDVKAIINAEITNWINKLLHAFFADFVVYQSVFVKDWWEKKCWVRRNEYKIIYNGVDLQEFFPGGAGEKRRNRPLICLEGHLDYSPFAIDLINELNSKILCDFRVYGRIKFDRERAKLSKSVQYLGEVRPDDLPLVYRNSIYLSLDVNPACPNAVIEALACGSPVIGFDTGALRELVSSNAGVIVPYGGNPWRLEYPNTSALLDAIARVVANYEEFSFSARKKAVREFDIVKMTNEYLEVIQKLLK